MCATCGFPAAPGHWTDAGAATGPDKLRARFRRAQVLQAVLSVYGLSAYDGGLIPGIQISTRSGSETIVPNLTDVWVLAEVLTGCPLDPLDPRFLGAGDMAS